MSPTHPAQPIIPPLTSGQENITVCCITSIQHQLSEMALRRTLEMGSFGKGLFISDRPPQDNSLLFLPIPAIANLQQYNRFILKELWKHINTSHVLLVQYDGFAINPKCWKNEFLNYDYIGAPWPWHRQYSVGNGGFSLRSKRLLQATDHPLFETLQAPEDELICRIFRSYLEVRQNIHFPPESIASDFSIEHGDIEKPSFGFHGLFNIHHTLPIDAIQGFINEIEPSILGGPNTTLWLIKILQEKRKDIAAMIIDRSDKFGITTRLISQAMNYGFPPEKLSQFIKSLK